MVSADKMIPHNVEAEEALLGSVLIDPQCFRKIRGIDSKKFYVQKNAWMWEALGEIVAKGHQIDHVSLCDELEEKGRLEEVGGAAYITHLINAVPSALSVQTYADRVAVKAQRRNLIWIASKLAQKAYAEENTPEEIVSEIVPLFSRAVGGQAMLVPANELVEAHWRDVEYWAANPVADGIRGMRTGIKAFDIPLGGVEKGLLTLVASRPRVGKTALLAQVALNLALAGHKVIVFELEMNSGQIIARMASSLSGVRGKAIKAGKAESDEYELYSHALARITDLRGKLCISDVTNISTIDASAATALMPDVDIVIADHLRLFSDPDQNEVRRLGKISWQLKQLAKTGIAVICAAQLNRGSAYRADKRPRLEDLRQSGELEENADNVLGLYRPLLQDVDEAINNERETTANLSEPHALEMLGLKYREGEGNFIGEACFDPSCMRITNYGPKV